MNFLAKKYESPPKFNSVTGERTCCLLSKHLNHSISTARSSGRTFSTPILQKEHVSCMTATNQSGCPHCLGKKPLVQGADMFLLVYLAYGTEDLIS